MPYPPCDTTVTGRRKLPRSVCLQTEATQEAAQSARASRTENTSPPGSINGSAGSRPLPAVMRVPKSSACEAMARFRTNRSGPSKLTRTSRSPSPSSSTNISISTARAFGGTRASADASRVAACPVCADSTLSTCWMYSSRVMRPNRAVSRLLSVRLDIGGRRGGVGLASCSRA